MSSQRLLDDGQVISFHSEKVGSSQHEAEILTDTLKPSTLTLWQVFAGHSVQGRGQGTTAQNESSGASHATSYIKTKNKNNVTDGSETEDTGEFSEQKEHVVKTVGATVDAENRTNLCPDNPPGLIGESESNMTTVTKTEVLQMFPDLENGGHLRPTYCRPLQKVALIVPYRNRYQHLHILLHNLIPFLTRQLVDIRFIVIEQAGNSTFNRGALLNVGFMEADKLDQFDCYIFHDVDMIPRNDHSLYRCGDRPRHFAVALSRYYYKLWYQKFFGGVVGFTREQYLKVNGNSNLYTGWGGEDDDLFKRVYNKNLTMVRYDVKTAKYDTFNHLRDEGNEVNPLRHVLLKYADKRQDVEGLNTVQYKVLGIKVEQLYTWITVSLNNSFFIESAPSFMEEYFARLKKLGKRLI